MFLEACIVGVCIIIAGGLIGDKLEVLALTMSNIWDEMQEDAAEAEAQQK